MNKRHEFLDVEYQPDKRRWTLTIEYGDADSHLARLAYHTIFQLGAHLVGIRERDDPAGIRFVFEADEGDEKTVTRVNNWLAAITDPIPPSPHFVRDDTPMRSDPR